MGTDKCFVPYDGAPLVRRVADALARAGAVSVHCIGGDGDRLRSLGLEARPDAHPGEGPLGAVVQVLEDDGAAELTAILAVDLLRPDPATIRVLAERAAIEPADVTLPRSDGHLQVMHGVWRRSAAPHLRARYAAGERSLTGAIAGLGAVRAIELTSPSFLDADTPEQLRYAERETEGHRST